MRILVFIILTVASFVYGVSQNINISLFNSERITEFTFSSDSGKYDIISNNKMIGTIVPSESFMFRLKKSKIKITDNQGKNYGNHKDIHIRGRKQSNQFTITPSEDKLKTRNYDNDLYLYIENEKIKIINDVNFEKYIAGVVESEGGPSAPPEYYKTQSILCRTYALKHFDKHLEDGFNLCDEVHCQAYKGKCIQNREIYTAAIETAGLVIVDNHLRIISATFFANSGGETANSEDVWLNPITYLRGIKDTFSLNQPGAKWEKKILKNDWIQYLLSKQLQLPDSDLNFSFLQKSRKKDYIFNNQSIPLKHIRKDWQLRSTFFSIEDDGANLTFKGKGYGHGVGLSQEGAMQMARNGYNYEQIINHYYTNVKIMSIKALDFFQIE